MTQRSYYEDAYTTSFQAEVKEVVQLDGRPGLILDQTYFYPSSGGQPHDCGTINGVEVEEVIVQESNSAIIHLVAAPISPKKVSCEIDWKRRFDHMQQHSGQHILSQAFLRTLRAQTLGFHMGSSSSTIDIDIPHLTDEETAVVERQANQVIWENKPVYHQFTSPAEIGNLQMRKIPPGMDHELRLVVIEDFDISACGGTHVSSTGEIGLLKINGWERRGQSSRVEFLCGGRALLDYSSKNNVLRNLSALYTTSYTELERSVTRQADELTTLRKRVKKQEKRLLDVEVKDLLQEIDGTGEGVCFTRVFTDKAPDELRYIAYQLVHSIDAVVLLAAVGVRTSLIFAKSEQSRGDMNQLLSEAFNKLGSGSGGGSPTIAQGSSEITEIESVKAVLEQQCRVYHGLC